MLPVMEKRMMPVSSCASRSEEERENEFLALLTEVQDPEPRLVEELFRFLRCWWQEVGPSDTLQNAVCEKLRIDHRVFAIYRHCPALIEMMEVLRKGEPIRRVREHWAFSEGARTWWYALLVIRVLLKCDGLILHSRLLRWLGHRADAQRIRESLASLREAGLLDTYQVKGTDPLRPVTWHRLLK